MSKVLSKLQAKREVLEAKIKKHEAHEKVVARKQKLQREVLIGRYHLEKAREDNTVTQLYAAMQEWAVREVDKKLFQSNA